MNLLSQLCELFSNTFIAGTSLVTYQIPQGCSNDFFLQKHSLFGSVQSILQLCIFFYLCRCRSLPAHELQVLLGDGLVFELVAMKALNCSSESPLISDSRWESLKGKEIFENLGRDNLNGYCCLTQCLALALNIISFKLGCQTWHRIQRRAMHFSYFRWRSDKRTYGIFSFIKRFVLRVLFLQAWIHFEDVCPYTGSNLWDECENWCHCLWKSWASTCRNFTWNVEEGPIISHCPFVSLVASETSSALNFTDWVAWFPANWNEIFHNNHFTCRHLHVFPSHLSLNLQAETTSSSALLS